MKRGTIRAVSGAARAASASPMKSAYTLFLSHIIGKRVMTQDGKTLGRLVDLLADPALVRPKIVAAVVLSKGQQLVLDFSKINIADYSGRYLLTCKEAKPANLKGMDTVRLAGQLLKKQVVDMNKKRTVTVYDLKMAIVKNEATVVAVDAGLQGQLRRIGVADLVQKVLKAFDVSLANQMVLWDNVEAINPGKTGVGLSKSITNLGRLHPSDMADIMEDLDSSTQAEIFSAMETERAADVLEELESDTRESLLESLPADKIADVLELMPADEAADILDEVDEEKADLLLREMDSVASVKIRDLMEYEDYEVGSLMTTDFVCFHETNTVEATLEILRREKPESDMIYYLYIVSDRGELQAEVSLRDFVVSSPDAKLGDIMNRDIVFVQDTDKIETLHDMIAKYSMLAVPVVDAFQKLVGIVIINDVIFTLLRSKRRRP